MLRLCGRRRTDGENWGSRMGRRSASGAVVDEFIIASPGAELPGKNTPRKVCDNVEPDEYFHNRGSLKEENDYIGPRTQRVVIPTRPPG